MDREIVSPEPLDTVEDFVDCEFSISEEELVLLRDSPGRYILFCRYRDLFGNSYESSAGLTNDERPSRLHVRRQETDLLDIEYVSKRV